MAVSPPPALQRISVTASTSAAVNCWGDGRKAVVAVVAVVVAVVAELAAVVAAVMAAVAELTAVSSSSPPNSSAFSKKACTAASTPQGPP